MRLFACMLACMLRLCSLHNHRALLIASDCALRRSALGGVSRGARTRRVRSRIHGRRANAANAANAAPFTRLDTKSSSGKASSKSEGAPYHVPACFATLSERANGNSDFGELEAHQIYIILAPHDAEAERRSLIPSQFGGTQEHRQLLTATSSAARPGSPSRRAFFYGGTPGLAALEHGNNTQQQWQHHHGPA